MYRLFKWLIVSIIFITLISTIYETRGGNTQSSQNSDYCGLIIPIYSHHDYNQQIEIGKLINRCLKNKIIVYWLTEEMECSTSLLDNSTSTVTITVPKGSFLISLPEQPEKIQSFAANLTHLHFWVNVSIYFLMEPLKDIHLIKLQQPRIAYHAGDNVAFYGYRRTLQDAGFPDGVELGWNEIPEYLNTKDFDVFIWGGHTGGNLDLFLGQTNIRTYNTIRRFIQEGGGYVGSCYGGFQITTGKPFPFNLPQTRFPLLPTMFFLSVSTRFPMLALPGRGEINITLVDTTSPLTYGLPEEIPECWYVQGPMFLGMDGNTRTIATIQSINDDRWWYENKFEDYTLINKLKDRWMAFALNKPIWVTTEFGDGIVIAFGDHPELHDHYPRIVYNALYLATSKDEQTTSLIDNRSLFTLEQPYKGCFRGYVEIPLEFSVNTSQQTNLYAVTWAFNEYNDKTDLFCNRTYYSPGNYIVVVTAVDQQGQLSISKIPIRINEQLDITFSHHPSTPTVNQQTMFTSEITGGFLPYTVRWEVDGKTISTNETAHCMFPRTGNHLITLTVTDDLGSQKQEHYSIFIDKNGSPDNDDENNTNYLSIIFIILIGSFVAFLIIKKILSKRYL